MGVESTHGIAVIAGVEDLSVELAGILRGVGGRVRLCCAGGPIRAHKTPPSQEAGKQVRLEDEPLKRLAEKSCQARFSGDDDERVRFRGGRCDA